MKLSTVTFLAGLASLATFASGQGYKSTCELNGTYYYEDNIGRPLFHITCRARNGTRRRSEMDLNLCVANYGGQLAPANNGNFYKSCARCRPDHGYLLGCYLCGGTRDPRLDLNTVLTNDNGILRCFNHFGKELPV